MKLATMFAPAVNPRPTKGLTNVFSFPKPVSRPPEPRILNLPLDGMPIHAYHSHESLSHSLLKHLEPLQPPLEFWHHSWMNPARVIDADDISEGMYFGKLMHAYMEDVSTIHGLIPAARKNGKMVKRTKKPGFIGADQLEAMHRLREKLLAIPLVAALMTAGKPEVSIFARWGLNPSQQEAFGVESVPVRCRPDLWSPKVVVHWKFCARLDPFFLGQTINRLRYVEGLAWYREVERLAGTAEEGQRHIIYFCETRAPYKILPMEVPAELLDIAHNRNEMCVERFVRLCHEHGTARWPDYPHRPQLCRPWGEGDEKTFMLPPAWDIRG